MTRPCVAAKLDGASREETGRFLAYMDTQDRLILHSYAKVNLTLEVSSLRPDGFHDIDSVVSVIDLCDEMVAARADSGIQVTAGWDEPGPWGRDNTVYQAADVFFKTTGIKGGAHFLVRKRILSQAGLGGGSGNAATAISALDRLYDTRLSTTDMCAMGAQVGSDVPLFIVGGTVRMRGRGEIVEPLPDAPELNIVVVKPDAGVSTAWAYAELDRVERQANRTSDAAEHAIRSGDRAALLGCLSNDFQPVIFSANRDILRCAEKLMDAGAKIAVLCGSGSSVFGVFESADQAVARAHRIRGHSAQVFVTKTITRAESILVH